MLTMYALGTVLNAGYLIALAGDLLQSLCLGCTRMCGDRIGTSSQVLVNYPARRSVVKCSIVCKFHCYLWDFKNFANTASTSLQ